MSTINGKKQGFDIFYLNGLTVCHVLTTFINKNTHL